MDSRPTHKSFDIKWNSKYAEWDSTYTEFKRKVQTEDGDSPRVLKVYLKDLTLACGEEEVLIGQRVRQRAVNEMLQDACKKQMCLQFKLDDSEVKEFSEILVNIQKQNINNLSLYVQYLCMIYVIKVKISIRTLDEDAICNMLTKGINENKVVLFNLMTLWMADMLILRPVIKTNFNCKKGDSNDLKQSDDVAIQKIENLYPARTDELWDAVLCPEITSRLLALGGGNIQLLFRCLSSKCNEMVLKHWEMDLSSILIKESVNGLIINLFRHHLNNKLEAPELLNKLFKPQLNPNSLSTSNQPALCHRKAFLPQAKIKENEDKIEFASKYKFQLCLILNGREECNDFIEISTSILNFRKKNNGEYSTFKKHSRNIQIIKCSISEDPNNRFYRSVGLYFELLKNTITENVSKLYTNLEVIYRNEIAASSDI